MKCVAIENAKNLVIKEIEEPISNGKDVLIHVEKCGICGSDIHNWDAGEPKGLVMGHEFCGTVIDPGSREDLTVGDKVTALPISPCGVCDACITGNPQYCQSTWSEAIGLSLENPGGFTSKILVRPDMVLKVPDNMSDIETAMVEPLGVALHAVHLANIQVGAKVLVIGGGIIGLTCAQLAKKEGASSVILTETNPARGDKAIALGVVDEYYLATDEKTVPELISKTGGGFDVVLECVGNAPAVNSSFTLVKPGGTVVLVGVSNEALSIYTILPVMKELTIKGAIGYTKKEFADCISLISDKMVDVKKFYSKEVSLEEVQGAFEELTSGTTDAIKIIVDPNK